MAAVSSLKKKKAANPEDRVTGEMIKWAPEEFKEIIWKVFQGYFKYKDVPSKVKTASWILLFKGGDKTDIARWRPIALLSLMYKLPAQILARRLSGYAERYKILKEEQAGARPGRTIMDRVRMLIAAIEDNRLANSQIVMAYIDLTNAFGLVNRTVLFQTMEKMRFPSDVIEMLRNMYKGASIRVGSAHGWTVPIEMKTGIHQGCPLSPLLFTIVLETLLALLRSSKDGYRFRAADEVMAGAAFR